MRRERLFGLTFMAVATAGMAIFIWLNYLSVRSLSDSPSPLAILGKQAWQRAGCVECHTIFGNGGYNAPDLTRVTDRRSDKAITDWLTTGPVIRPTTKTAHVAVAPADAESILEFLKYIATVPNMWDGQPGQPKGAGR
ncbi:MAG: c-type cytochrome [Bacillota bacterium]